MKQIGFVIGTLVFYWRKTVDDFNNGVSHAFNYWDVDRMKPGQIVHIKINMQPLAVGDRGVVESIATNGSQHPIMVKWDKLQHVLPMKWDEVK